MSSLNGHSTTSGPETVCSIQSSTPSEVERGIVHVNDLKNSPVLCRNSSGGARGTCARKPEAIAGVTNHRPGTDNIGVDSCPSSADKRTPVPKRKVDRARTHHDLLCMPLAPTPIRPLPVGIMHVPVLEGCSSSVQEDVTVKTEVTTAPKTDLTGAFPVDPAAEERVTLSRDGSPAEPGGPVKAEVAIFLPSKRASAEGDLRNKCSLFEVSLRVFDGCASPSLLSTFFRDRKGRETIAVFVWNCEKWLLRVSAFMTNSLGGAWWPAPDGQVLA